MRSNRLLDALVGMVLMLALLQPSTTRADGPDDYSKREGESHRIGVVVGLNWEPSNAGGFGRLRWGVRDAARVVEVMLERGGFHKVMVLADKEAWERELMLRPALAKYLGTRLFLIGEPTAQGIAEALRDLREEVHRRDQVLIYMATHGFELSRPKNQVGDGPVERAVESLDASLGLGCEKDNKRRTKVPFLAGSDSSMIPGQERGLSQCLVGELVEALPSEQVLFVKDACVSGRWMRGDSGSRLEPTGVMRAEWSGSTAEGNTQEFDWQGAEGAEDDGGGVFTYYWLLSLGVAACAADTNHDGIVDDQEAFNWILHRAPVLRLEPSVSRTTEGSAFFPLAPVDEAHCGEIPAWNDTAGESRGRGEDTQIGEAGGVLPTQERLAGGVLFLQDDDPDRRLRLQVDGQSDVMSGELPKLSRSIGADGRPAYDRAGLTQALLDFPVPDHTGWGNSFAPEGPHNLQVWDNNHSLYRGPLHVADRDQVVLERLYTRHERWSLGAGIGARLPLTPRRRGIAPAGLRAHVRATLPIPGVRRRPLLLDFETAASGWTQGGVGGFGGTYDSTYVLWEETLALRVRARVGMLDLSFGPLLSAWLFVNKLAVASTGFEVDGSLFVIPALGLRTSLTLVPGRRLLVSLGGDFRGYLAEVDGNTGLFFDLAVTIGFGIRDPGVRFRTKPTREG